MRYTLQVLSIIGIVDGAGGIEGIGDGVGLGGNGVDIEDESGMDIDIGAEIITHDVMDTVSISA